MNETFSITNTTRSKEPALPYENLKNDILGKKYALSLVFVGQDRARALNMTHRGKTYVPNVLSFPIDEKNGEIFIAPKVAAREAKKYDLSVNGYIAYLFIHGLLHLKGLDHGDTMEKAEARYMTAYRIS